MRIMKFFRCSVDAYLLILMFLLPVKFAGTIVGVPEIPASYSLDAVDLLFMSWPTAWFYFSAGLYALLVPIAYPQSFSCNWRDEIVPWLWLGLAVWSLVGFINASVADFAWQQTAHLFAAAAFVLGAAWHCRANPRMSRLIFAVSALAMLTTVLLGWYQYFVGIRDTLEFLDQEQARAGYKFADNLRSRLAQVRIFSSFALCNNFAGYLILVLPVSVWMAWRAGGMFEPPRISRILFVALTLILSLPILLLAGSRAAIIALAASMTLCSIPFWRLITVKARFFCLALVFAAVGAAVYAANRGRGFESLWVRLDYFRAAAESMLNHPWLGTGWGDFFHEYTWRKTVVSAEAPHTPHNLFLAFGSQTGVPGLLLSVVALFAPVVLLFRRLNTLDYSPATASQAGGASISGASRRGAAIHKNRGLPSWREKLESPAFPVLIGWLAWSLHSVLDLNLQVPSALATGLILFVGANAEAGVTRGDFKRDWKFGIGIAIRLLAAVGAMFLAVVLSVREKPYSEMREFCSPHFKDPGEFAAISLSEVAARLEKCRTAAPDSPFAWGLAADFAAARGDLVAAEAYLRQAAKRSPERSHFHYKLYLLRMRLGDESGAAAALAVANRLFPLHPRYKKAPER